MKTINKISTTLCMSLALVTAHNTASFATDPGSMEAINSASEDRRNIVGMEISTATDDERAAVGCKEEGGVFVSAVIPKHPAAIAGLKARDVIVQIDGKPVRDHSEALNIMNGLDAGRSYPFVVYRKAAPGAQQRLVFNILVEKVQEKAIGKIS